MRGKPIIFATVIISVIAAIAPAAAEADGGTVRHSERRGDRSITVFTSPTPLRAGLVDVSVLVLDANTGTPLVDVPVDVPVAPFSDDANLSAGAPSLTLGLVPDGSDLALHSSAATVTSVASGGLRQRSHWPQAPTAVSPK